MNLQNGRIDTAVTVQHRPQSDRQSLRFALNSDSSQSENISGVTQERIQDSSENKNAACAFKVIPWFLSRTMCRRIEMKAIKLFAALVVCSMATSAQAGLFGCFKSNSGCGCSVEPTCCAPVEASCCAPADCCNTCGDSCGCGHKSCFKMPKLKLPKLRLPKFKLPKCNFGGCGSSCGSSCCSEPTCCAPAACGSACEPTCCAPVEASCCAPAACGGCN